MNIRRQITLTILLCTVATTFTGCGGTPMGQSGHTHITGQPSGQDHNAHSLHSQSTVRSNVYGDKSSTPAGGTISARAIADEIRVMPGVKNAWVLIQGSAAYVGLTMHDKHPLTTELSKGIQDRVRSLDHRVTEVNMTPNPAVSSKIAAVADDLESGRSLDDSGRQFEDLKAQLWSR